MSLFLRKKGSRKTPYVFFPGVSCSYTAFTNFIFCWTDFLPFVFIKRTVLEDDDGPTGILYLHGWLRRRNYSIFFELSRHTFHLNAKIESDDVKFFAFLYIIIYLYIYITNLSCILYWLCGTHFRDWNSQ